MSWFSKNYEKTILGGAVVVALGIAYFGWDKFNSVAQDFDINLKGGGNNNTAVNEAELIPKAKASLKFDRTWVQAVDGDRSVDLFTGIPLFVSSSAPDKPLDLIRGASVHAPIPNKWWIDNRLDPGYGDSPSRDPDEDGFSNLEEFKAKTDPNDAKLFPPLIMKLMYVKDETLIWVLRPGFGAEGSFPFNYQDSKGAQNHTAVDMVGPNGLLFAKAPMKDRFKVISSEVVKEINKRTKLEKDVTMVTIEDQRPNKIGVTYKIPSPLTEDRMNEYRQYDRTAVFSLEALGLHGKEFSVEERTAFAVPPNSGKKDYFLKSMTAESVTVEYTTPTGEKKSVEIGKGSVLHTAD